MKRVFFTILASLVLAYGNIAQARVSFDESSQKQLVLSNMSLIPLAFAENLGQFGDRALFKAETGGATFYFCKDEVVYLFVRNTNDLIEDDSRSIHKILEMSDELKKPHYKKETLTVKVQFVNANPYPEVVGVDRLPHNNNYFLGNDPSKWRTDVPNYSTIIYKDIYPGIDLKYYGNGQSMKYDFIIRPGADISQIKIRYDGVENLCVTPTGDLQADTRFGLIHEKIPYIYQEIDGVIREVAGRYETIESGIFGFVLERGYNLNLPLIIDPELSYSTYLGGSNEDIGYGIAIDGAGCVYLTGSTASSEFPIVNPYDDSYNGEEDVFVAKLSPAGNALLYSTYLGGCSYDEGLDIAVDVDGCVYLTGYTISSDFPTENAYDDSYNGYADAFIANCLTSTIISPQRQLKFPFLLSTSRG